MEGSGTGISRLDCYEDMFKEISRKLYGEALQREIALYSNEYYQNCTLDISYTFSYCIESFAAHSNFFGKSTV